MPYRHRWRSIAGVLRYLLSPAWRCAVRLFSENGAQEPRWTWPRGSGVGLVQLCCNPIDPNDPQHVEMLKCSKLSAALFPAFAIPTLVNEGNLGVII